MTILIGGSSSTGSSLLQTILNRHEKLYCGPETSLFSKPILYSKWNISKYRILKKGWNGLRNPSWFLYNGTDLITRDGIWDRNELAHLIHTSDNLEEFANGFFQRYLTHYKKEIWIEKTPTNAHCFSLFLENFNNGKVIHMVRNPYETIASLVNRGYSPFFATGLYLCNTATALRSRKNPNYSEIRYENLTSEPERTLKDLCRFLGIDFDKNMLDYTKESLPMNNTIKGWSFSADAEIQKNEGRFDKLPLRFQKEIILFSNKMNLSTTKGPISIKDVCEVLNYPFSEDDSKVTMRHRMERWKDMWKRTIRTYPTHIFNYPISLL